MGSRSLMRSSPTLSTSCKGNDIIEKYIPDEITRDVLFYFCGSGRIKQMKSMTFFSSNFHGI